MIGPVKVVLNPTAGRGLGGRSEMAMRQLLAQSDIEFDLAKTAGKWHAAELAQQAVADGYELVVAAGGDGTVHEVVNGLMTAGRGTLGVLPIGSGSDFANTMGVAPDLPGACLQLANGRQRRLDAGRISVMTQDGSQHSRFFDNTTNIGFGGVVTIEALKIRRLRGTLLYLLAVLKTVFLYHRAPQITLEHDGQVLERPMLMLTVANGPREGGGFYVAPDASPEDGLFDLCIVDGMSRLGILSLIPHFLKGTHMGRKGITMARAQRVSVSSPEDLVAHVDGEVLCTRGRSIEFEILPRQLAVWC